MNTSIKSNNKLNKILSIILLSSLFMNTNAPVQNINTDQTATDTNTTTESEIIVKEITTSQETILDNICTNQLGSDLRSALGFYKFILAPGFSISKTKKSIYTPVQTDDTDHYYVVSSTYRIYKYDDNRPSIDVSNSRISPMLWKLIFDELEKTHVARVFFREANPEIEQQAVATDALEVVTGTVV